MSTDAEFADARHVPPIPPRPPRQPAPAADQDPRTAVLRRVPGAPAAPPAPRAAHTPTGPTPPAGRPGTPPPGTPAVPPRPTAPPPAPPGTQPPPRPDRAPTPPAAPPPPAGRPAAFRDTAAFHLAHSQELWNAARGRTDGPDTPGREPAAAPAGEPPQPAADRPAPPWPGSHLPPQRAGARPGMPATPPRRPASARRPGARALAAAACLVLGIGLIGGAAAGSWLTDDSADAPPSPQEAFTTGHDVWHSTPVDTLFPRTVNGLGVGPGGADRTWTRIAVAPDSGCADAYDPRLAQALATAGCARLLRATYVDATHSSLITVGAQTARTDPAGMMALNTRFSTKNLANRTDLMPLPYAPKGTPAEGFGRAQRASWTVRVLTDVPVIVYAVSGFADGRAVTEPQPAEAATRSGATTAPAESGLGHDAKDLADRVAADFRTAAGLPSQTTESSP